MPVGRPRALDDVKRGEVCALISAGCSVEAAARYVGCNPSTIRREAARNEDFHERLRRAELAAELQPLHALQRAAAKHWRAAAWLLERTRPDRFAKFPPNMMRIEEAEEVMESWLELIAHELPDTPECNAAYRRMNLAMLDTCRELRAATAVSRDPKRIRSIARGMKPEPKWPPVLRGEQPEDLSPEDADAAETDPAPDAKSA